MITRKDLMQCDLCPMETTSMPRIGDKAPDFEANTTHGHQPRIAVRQIISQGRSGICGCMPEINKRLRRCQCGGLIAQRDLRIC